LRLLIERDNARNNWRSVFTRNHLRRIALHERDKRVGGAQVNADDALLLFCHEAPLQDAPLPQNAPSSIVHYWNGMLVKRRRCSPACAHSGPSLKIRRMPIDKTVIATKDAPAAIGPYTQAIRTGDFLFMAGQIALDPATMQLVSGGIVEQTERSIANIRGVLSAAALSFANVVKVTVFMKDLRDFAAMNEVYARAFVNADGTAPPRSTVQVAALPKDALVEIECIARG